MGEFKKDWRRARIGEIVKRSVETVPIAERGNFERFVGVDHLDTDDLELRRWGDVSGDLLPPTFRYVFRSGMVLFPTRRPALRKCSRATFDGLTGEKLLVLVSADERRLHSSFLPHLLASPLVKRWATEKAVGSVTPHFRWSDLAECAVPLPPVNRQIEYARLLDTLWGVDDSLRAAQTRGEVVQRAFLESHFNTHAERQASVLDHVRALSGGTPSRAECEYWSGTVPWLSPKDMKTNIVSDTSEHISEAAVSAGHALAPAGTTFIVVRGMILQHTFPVCLAAVPMAFNQDVKALVPKEDLEPEYLALWCRWAAPRLLRQVSETSHGTKRLEFDRIRSMPFSSATRREQVALIDEHRDLEEVVSAIDSKRAALARVQCSVLSRMGAA